MTNFFNALFGKKTDFREGDYFFVEHENTYVVYKVLVVHEDTVHVLTFAPLDIEPKFTDKNSLRVLAWHAPIAKSGFQKPTILGNAPVSLNELQGYHVYLVETEQLQEQIEEAQRLYKNALDLHDKHKLDEAIEHYSAAANVFPQFFEANDNKGFCYMTLGNWSAAVDSFEKSLSVNPKGLAAIFSLGECHLRMENYDKAHSFFTQAAELNPSNPDIETFQKLAKEKQPHPNWVT